jgi:hypothetical protein
MAFASVGRITREMYRLVVVIEAATPIIAMTPSADPV